jgi:hypothetical protein
MPGNNKNTAGADAIPDSESTTSAYEQDSTESEVETSSNILSHAGAPGVCDPTQKPATDEIAVELEGESKEAEKVPVLEDGSESKKGSGAGLAELANKDDKQEDGDKIASPVAARAETIVPTTPTKVEDGSSGTDLRLAGLVREKGEKKDCLELEASKVEKNNPVSSASTVENFEDGRTVSASERSTTPSPTKPPQAPSSNIFHTPQVTKPKLDPGFARNTFSTLATHIATREPPTVRFLDVKCCQTSHG